MNPSSLVRHRGTWTFDSKVPVDWPELVHRHNGGFFHTPLGLRAGAPDGEPVFARFYCDTKVAGIAVGVRTECRLSGYFKHLYFPTWPAFADADARAMGMTRLAASLREGSIAEVRWDSLDGSGDLSPSTRPTCWEYVMDLQRMAERGVRALPVELRDALRRGDQAGWTVHELSGLEAANALLRVAGPAMPRMPARGTGINAVVPPVVTDHAPHSPFWGTTTYAVIEGGQLLAAALVGHTGSRAYCLMGGATQAGQLQGAITWLHAHLIGRFTAAGFTRYNLGQSGASLGARTVPCAREQWVLMAAHLRSHQLYGVAAGMVS